MNHPKHFWMFKILLEHLNNNGYKYMIFVSDKDVLSDLLRAHNYNYIKLGRNKKHKIWKIFQMVHYIIIMIYYCIKFKPSILIGQALPHFAIASFFFKKQKFYILEDTEHVSLLHKITVPFCTKIFTTEMFPMKFGKKQIQLKTYYELLYLHPNYFTPDFSILLRAKIFQNKRYAVIRLVSWNAHHDKNQTGIDSMFLDFTIKLLESHGLAIFISSEVELPEHLMKYKNLVDSKDIHSLLYFASIYIGEGATLAAEAALLGVPSIYINSLDTNYCRELSDRYNLLFNFRNSSGVADIIPDILLPEIKSKQAFLLNKMFKDKIDPSKYFIDLILCNL